jgi:hypothetical protein
MPVKFPSGKTTEVSLGVKLANWIQSYEKGDHRTASSTARRPDSPESITLGLVMDSDGRVDSDHHSTIRFTKGKHERVEER